LLLFGPTKFADLGKGLGEGIRNFKAAVKDDKDAPKDTEKKSSFVWRGRPRPRRYRHNSSSEFGTPTGRNLLFHPIGT